MSPAALTDADVAVEAARAGAAVARDRFGRGIRRTADRGVDFTSEVDVAAERAIRAVLAAHRPHDAVVGAELGGNGDAVRRWLVDPICGTLNYAVRSMLVAVNVALRAGSGTIAAASADPFSDEVFWTDGTRARVRAGGTDAPLAPSSASNLVDVNLDPPFPNAPAFRAAGLLADAGFAARFRPRVVSTTLATGAAVTMSWSAAHRPMSWRSIAAAMRSGNRSGVHANDGTPRPASAAACSAS